MVTAPLLIFAPNKNNLIVYQLREKKNVVYIHTKNYYSPKDRNELMIHAATWMNLKNVMLNRRNYL